jgi:hypothetical protein
MSDVPDQREPCVLGEEHDKHNNSGSSVSAAMFVQVGVEDGGVRTKALQELRSK